MPTFTALLVQLRQKLVWATSDTHWMQRFLSCLLVVLPPCAWAVASDYNYDINYYNDYELFDKGYQYDDHDAPPEYVSPYAGSYDDEVSHYTLQDLAIATLL